MSEGLFQMSTAEYEQKAAEYDAYLKQKYPWRFDREYRNARSEKIRAMQEALWKQGSNRIKEFEDSHPLVPAEFTNVQDTSYVARNLYFDDYERRSEEIMAYKSHNSYAKQQDGQIFNQYLHGRHLPMRFYKSFMVLSKLIEQGDLDPNKAFRFVGSVCADITPYINGEKPFNIWLLDRDLYNLWLTGKLPCGPKFHKLCKDIQQTLENADTITNNPVYQLYTTLREALSYAIPSIIGSLQGINENSSEAEIYAQVRFQLQRYLVCTSKMSRFNNPMEVMKNFNIQVIQDLLSPDMSVTQNMIDEFKKYFKVISTKPGCFMVYFNCSEDEFKCFKLMKFLQYRFRVSTKADPVPTTFLLRDKVIRFHDGPSDFVRDHLDNRARRKVVSQYLGIYYPNDYTMLRLIVASHYSTFVDRGLRNNIGDFLRVDSFEDLCKYISVEKIAAYMKAHGLKLF